VNADCFQMEFGMMAGRFIFSCRCIQNANAGIKARAIERRTMLATSLIPVELPVITLSQICQYFSWIEEVQI
jgi:hypothetical protein